MAETKPVTTQTNIRLIKNIVCILLVAAVAIAAVAFDGRKEALEANAALMLPPDRRSWTPKQRKPRPSLLIWLPKRRKPRRSLPT